MMIKLVNFVQELRGIDGLSYIDLEEVLDDCIQFNLGESNFLIHEFQANRRHAHFSNDTYEYQMQRTFAFTEEFGNGEYLFIKVKSKKSKDLKVHTIFLK